MADPFCCSSCPFLHACSTCLGVHVLCALLLLWVLHFARGVTALLNAHVAALSSRFDCLAIWLFWLLLIVDVPSIVCWLLGSCLSFILFCCVTVCHALDFFYLSIWLCMCWTWWVLSTSVSCDAHCCIFPCLGPCLCPRILIFVRYQQIPVSTGILNHTSFGVYYRGLNN